MPLTTRPDDTGAIRAARPSSPGCNFDVLDGLRGVAACCVFFYHALDGIAARNGFLSVDFFFLLSGFVIAHSYGARLASGQMSFGTFAKRRFVRLYPMVAAGTVLGAAVLMLHNLSNPDEAYGVGDLTRWTLSSLLILPYLTPSPFQHAVFPVNVVLWSLCMELIANLVYARLIGFMSKRMLAAIAAVSLTVMMAYGQVGAGSSLESFWFGFPRVGLGFFSGVLIYHLRDEGALPALRIGLAPSALLLVILTMLPAIHSAALMLPVMLIFAALLLGAANTRADRATTRWCGALGRFSYPFYLIHLPALAIIVGVMKHVMPISGTPYVVLSVVAFAFIAVTAWWVADLYERPACALLGRLCDTLPGRVAGLCRATAIAWHARHAGGSLGLREENRAMSVVRTGALR